MLLKIRLPEQRRAKPLVRMKCQSAYRADPICCRYNIPGKEAPTDTRAVQPVGGHRVSTSLSGQPNQGIPQSSGRSLRQGDTRQEDRRVLYRDI
eukprot:752036-Hanusia_phi.AAC.1